MKKSRIGKQELARYERINKSQRSNKKKSCPKLQKKLSYKRRRGLSSDLNLTQLKGPTALQRSHNSKTDARWKLKSLNKIKRIVDYRTKHSPRKNNYFRKLPHSTKHGRKRLRTFFRAKLAGVGCRT